MSLPVSNATMQIQRRTYNASTKQDTLANVGSPFGALIKDLSHQLAERGMSTEWPIKIVVSAADLPAGGLQDGDQLTGWNPNAVTTAPLLLIQHVSGPYTAPGLPQAAFVSANAKMLYPGGIHA